MQMHKKSKAVKAQNHSIEPRASLYFLSKVGVDIYGESHPLLLQIFFFPSFKEIQIQSEAEDFERHLSSFTKMALFEVLFKRTSTFALTVAVGAFVFERTFDAITNTVFDNINAGKQWKDIKKNYES